jgi:hypothetical protein
MPMRECWEALAALKCAYCWFELFERLIKSPSCPSRRYFVVVSATLVHREALCALEGTVGGSCGAQVCAVLMESIAAGRFVELETEPYRKRRNQGSGA